MSHPRGVPDTAEVVIVGGGVMGTSIAFHLAEAGVSDVVLVERGELAGGSTSKAAGGVRAQFSDPVNIALGARSLSAFERFAARPGREIDLRQVGYLFLHTDSDAVAAAEAAVARQRSMGVPTRFVTRDEVASMCPAVVCDDVLAATFHPRDGFCSPDAVVHGYAAAAQRRGATVRTGVQVLRIQRSGTAITGVTTSAGTVSTRGVICAAGAWSRAVGKMAGVELPVTPLRRQILVTEPLAAQLAPRFPATMPMTVDAATTFYLHREGPGVLLGMSFQSERPGFCEDYDEAWLPDLTAAVERRCPALLEVGIAHRWAGLYEVTPDHNALIGESSEVSRFLYATGFSGHGFLQGPAVGEVVRDLWLGREPVVEVGPLHADRFRSGRHRVEHGIV